MGLDLLLNQLLTTLVPKAIQAVITVSPIILVIILAKIFWTLWLNYIRSSFFLSLKYSVLELKLPKETFKSPLAMEVFLSSLHNTADGSEFAQYWKGETRPWYSLEIISIEGQVKFIIWTEDRRKSNLIAALYSQFPGIEVHEIPDYAKTVHFDPDKTRIWAAEMKLSRKDSEPLPIKTYVDFGLDRDPKEEYKVDPLVPMLEFMGSLPPNAQVWIQIMIRAHKGEEGLPGFFMKRGDVWKENVEKYMNKIMVRDAKSKISGLKKDGKSDFVTISQGENEMVYSLERRMTKKVFDVGIRCLYITKKENYDPVFGIGGIIGSFGQFSGENTNGIRPNGDKLHPLLGDPWQDYKNMRRNTFARIGLDAYKRRSYFYTPYDSKPLVMNTEEIATLYHFPGQVAQTPTLERIPSKKSQAPSNLPI